MLEASDESVEPLLALPRIDVAASRPVARQNVPPPPGIGHLMLWIACCALYLGIARNRFQEQPGAVGLLLLGAIGVSISLGWTGLAIVATRGIRGGQRPARPGEWLLAALGWRFAVEALIGLLDVQVVRDSQAIADALVCCLLVWPLLRDLPRPWTMALGAVIVVTALRPLLVVLSILGWIDVPPQSFWAAAGLLQPAALLAIVALAAAVEERHPGWLHRGGIVVFAYHQALEMVLALSL